MRSLPASRCSCPRSDGRAFAADARSAYLAGAAAQGVEDYELAIEQYKEALSLNPAYVEPMVGLAQSFLVLEEYDEASRFVGHGADIRQRTIRTWRSWKGGSASARETCRRPALFSPPCSRGSRTTWRRDSGMAEAEIADGRLKNALSQYAQTLKLAPESTRAVLSLAMLADETGDARAAGVYYELALRSHSSDPRVQLAAASWYAATGTSIRLKSTRRSPSR